MDNFTTILKLIRVIQNLHRPSKNIERKSSYEFLHQVFWSGLLANKRDGSKPTTKIILNATHLLTLERFFDPELWEAHYLENFLQAL